MRLGVDVGGTHTDAVIMDGRSVLASHKAVTSGDITRGIVAAAKKVLANSGVAATGIESVAIGTTQFTNAVVQRRGLAEVAAIRIGAQSTAAMPPFMEWPADLLESARGPSYMLDGGYEYDGREIVPLDERGLEAAVEDVGKRRITAVGVCGIFSPVNSALEDRVASRLREAWPDLYVATSHELGGLGLYQRENACLLNAALMPLATKVIEGFGKAFDALGINAPLFISQNDGTLMRGESAIHYPVLTFASGPTNSMRGAAFLSGISDGMVVDVGGTTSDIGMLIHGFPRPSGTTVDIGGVLTNFRMPDVLPVGLGGGSVVLDSGERVGPVSVGYELASKGLCFGGEVMTATDIGVASGLVELGDASKVRGIAEGVVDAAVRRIEALIADGIDRMRTSQKKLPLVAVGGGAFLVPETVPGISEVIRPTEAGVANAIGAALAQVGAEAEVVYSRGEGARERALEEASNSAKAKAASAGAEPGSIDIVEVEEIPMSYLAEPAVRLRVKAVGNAAHS